MNMKNMKIGGYMYDIKIYDDKTFKEYNCKPYFDETNMGVEIGKAIDYKETLEILFSACYFMKGKVYYNYKESDINVLFDTHKIPLLKDGTMEYLNADMESKQLCYNYLIWVLQARLKLRTISRYEVSSNKKEQQYKQILLDMGFSELDIVKLLVLSDIKKLENGFDFACLGLYGLFKCSDPVLKFEHCKSYIAFDIKFDLKVGAKRLKDFIERHQVNFLLKIIASNTHYCDIDRLFNCLIKYTLDGSYNYIHKLEAEDDVVHLTFK